MLQVPGIHKLIFIIICGTGIAIPACALSGTNTRLCLRYTTPVICYPCLFTSTTINHRTQASITHRRSADAKQNSDRCDCRGCGDKTTSRKAVFVDAGAAQTEAVPQMQPLRQGYRQQLPPCAYCSCLVAGIAPRRPLHMSRLGSPRTLLSDRWNQPARDAPRGI